MATDIIIPVWTAAVSDRLYTTIESVMAYTDNFRLILASSGESMPVNINRGLDIASSPYVAILDWDVEVSPGWLERLSSVLDTHPEVGIVGGNLQPNGYYDELPPDYTGPIPTLAAGCMLFRHTPIRFDERFPHGLWSDTDFCREYKCAGWEVWIDRTVPIIHHLHNSAPGSEGLCKEVYRAKWGDLFY